ncbi:hypothetical protein [Burkholderia sp. F1]|uniref:hypothetical protein n=1 Tax=Burkholderia sp. F1 TaxID=3366817 RepID=UPI003D71737D
MVNNVQISAHPDGICVDLANFSAVADYVSARSRQLESLLAMLAGDGWEAFDGMNPHHRENVLWLAGMLAAEVAGGVAELVSGAATGAEVRHG